MDRPHELRETWAKPEKTWRDRMLWSGDHKLRTSVEVPNSPSYPSEHAAAAQAAASVLAYLLPGEAQTFQAMADEAGGSRVQAGVQFPSDYYAGAELGRKVAQQVIAKAKADGSDPLGRADGRAAPPARVRLAPRLPMVLVGQVLETERVTYTMTRP